MVVADAEISLTITGNGDVLEPYDGVIGMKMLLLCPCMQLYAVFGIALRSNTSHQADLFSTVVFSWAYQSSDAMS